MGICLIVRWLRWGEERDEDDSQMPEWMECVRLQVEVVEDMIFGPRN